MSRLVIAIQQNLTITYFEDEMKVGSAIQDAVKFLSLVSEANDRSKAISYTAFYLDIINGDSFDVKRDYVNWKRPGLLSDSEFSFCQYPFVYEPSTKSDILAFENTGEMREQFQDAVFESIFSGGACPYLLLRVRHHVVTPNSCLCCAHFIAYLCSAANYRLTSSDAAKNACAISAAAVTGVYLCMSKHFSLCTEHTPQASARLCHAQQAYFMPGYLCEST